MYLLDTDVVCELRKVKARKAHPSVVAWNSTVTPTETFLSAISVLELERGVLRLERRDATQGAVMRAWIDEHVLPTFAGRILPIDAGVAQRSAELQIADPGPERDSLIAATALMNGMTIVTRNVRDYESTGVAVVNPWDWRR